MSPSALMGDHLEWALGWTWGPRAFVLALALAVLWLAALNLRALASWRRRGVLFGIRLALVASLLGVLMQPTWVSLGQRPGSRSLAVLVDRSASMAQAPAGQRRWDAALLAASKLAADMPVELLALDDRLEKFGSVRKLREAKPTGAGTDLLGALAALGESHRVAGLAAVLLLTDGLDNGDLRARNPAGPAPLDNESAEVIARLRVPVHSLLLADKAPVRDVALAAVRSSAFGFTRTFMPVSVDIEVSGYGKQSGSLAVTLSDNGRPSSTRQIPLAGPTRRTIDFDFQPLHVGPHLLEAAIVPLPDEATDSNNRGYATLHVVRDRTRVLHLAGHPSWDTRFLRSHLRGDPSVDLVSFYIMVGQGSGAFVSADDTTLIPFPTREIFEESLTSFDLVILQDFPFGPFQVEQYLPQLRAYVHGGGAFLVIGGKQALSAGGYYGTALAEWLPVRLQALGGADVGFSEGPLNLALTPAGATHPITQLAHDAETNAAVWAHHGWQGRNTALQAGESGHVLVTDSGGHPLLAVGEVDQGRSAVLATDSLWAWAFPPAAAEGARDRSRADYHQLLDQLFAWLLHDPDLDALRLEVVGLAGPSKPAQVRISAHGVNGESLPGLVLRVGWAPLTQMPAAPNLQTYAEQTDAQGQVLVTLPELPAGAHLVTVEAPIAGHAQRASVPLWVRAADREVAQLQPSDDLLQKLAASSGGRVWRALPKRQAISLAQPDAADLADRVHSDLWSRPGVLLWLVSLLGLEWTLRRRWGLA